MQSMSAGCVPQQEREHAEQTQQESAGARKPRPTRETTGHPAQATQQRDAPTDEAQTATTAARQQQTKTSSPPEVDGRQETLALEAPQSRTDQPTATTDQTQGLSRGTTPKTRRPDGGMPACAGDGETVPPCRGKQGKRKERDNDRKRGKGRGSKSSIS